MATLVDKYFSQPDFDAIEAAVKKAESHTSGEIIIDISSHSRHWNSLRLTQSFIIALAFALAALYLTRVDDWGVYYSSTQATLWGAIGFAIGYFAWGRFLLREKSRRKVVWNRALGLFHQITPTRGLTGVLIFVSLQEKQAAIVADKGIASKVSENYWHGPHTMIVRAMTQGKHAEGIIEAVETIAVELARHFPRKEDDINELPDKPNIID